MLVVCVDTTYQELLLCTLDTTSGDRDDTVVATYDML